MCVVRATKVRVVKILPCSCCRSHCDSVPFPPFMYSVILRILLSWLLLFLWKSALGYNSTVYYQLYIMTAPRIIIWFPVWYIIQVLGKFCCPEIVPMYTCWISSWRWSQIFNASVIAIQLLQYSYTACLFAAWVSFLQFNHNFLFINFFLYKNCTVVQLLSDGG